ncbi:hypothetical protein ACQX2H_10350 [Corynebacterium diphtheriae]
MRTNDYASLKVPGVPVPIKARTRTLRKVLKKDLPGRLFGPA